MRRSFLVLTSVLTIGLGGCQGEPEAKLQADILIKNGAVFIGDNSPAQYLTIAIKDDEIIYIGERANHIDASKTLDVKGFYVLPGFIDPHTHSMAELTSKDPETRGNRNYQFQGVTTVVNGNDGFGDPNVKQQMADLNTSGIGTNTALFIGHGALRKSVMGGDKRAPTEAELSEMRAKIGQAMEAGALGLSTGLFYAPGSFSNTEEVIALAKTAAKHGGVYDSHIRDEATYNIGLEAAVDEVIEIARQADISANIAHIKALGVDVWGKSDVLIANIETARAEGVKITADQYPWRASGTRISNALIPRWVKAGSKQDYLKRLNDPELYGRIKSETTENLRKRGGPEAVLITQTNPEWKGQTLGALAKKYKLSPVDTALKLAREGDARIASFNMSPSDIENFMQQDWVMTSSDGSSGHPRKYASFPKKFREYVINKNLMPVETFFYRSSGLVADTFGICDRGYLKVGYKADIAILDPATFSPKADYQNPSELSGGVSYLLINGEAVIANGEAQSSLPGQVLRRCERDHQDAE
ncbi:MAG: amidohydrolase family protein [Hellea sp.]